jgi:XTP/dITP diphosphohydrolase
MTNLIMVTHNKRKIAEANEIAQAYGIEVQMPQGGTEKLEIQSDSLQEVSKFSALEAYKTIQKPLVVDDSGLFVNSLHGFPGVYSASVLATIGNQGVLRLMEQVEDRKAHFECCITFYDGKNIRQFTEKVEGDITFNEKGDKGFGFDPIFAPDTYKGRSFGEFEIAEKNKISHRGKAFESFFKWYSNEQQQK